MRGLNLRGFSLVGLGVKSGRLTAPRALAVLALAALLAACATGGRSFAVDRVAELQPGRTTLPEATAILGEPEQVIANDQGVTAAQWLHVLANGWTGHVGTQQLVVHFGPDGRMKRVYSYQGVPLSEADRRRLQLGSPGVEQ